MSEPLIEAATQILSEISWNDTGINNDIREWRAWCDKCRTNVSVVTGVRNTLNIKPETALRNIVCPICDRKNPSTGPFQVSA